MKPILFSSLLASALLAAGPASASTWDIDPVHTSAQFSVKHLMVSTVRGEFSNVTGVLELNDKDVTKSHVDVTIDAKSLTTRVEKRDQHLKSADFFDVEKYPTLAFKSTKVTKAGKGLKVAGNLTIHGVTKPVILEVEPLASEAKDPWGNLRRGTTATTKINRKDFGLTWNKALETGGVVVGDDVAITLDVEMIKKAEANK